MPCTHSCLGRAEASIQEAQWQKRKHLIEAGKAHGWPQIKVLLNASSLQVPLHGSWVQVVAAQCHDVFFSHFSIHPSSCRHTRTCGYADDPID